jgi:hypothetical protein
VVTRIGSTTEYKDIALGAFLDIEESFDRTSFDIIKQAVEKHGTEPTICRWVCSMLESRNITATLSGETLGASMVRGCLQGGVLLPLLWSLVIVEFLQELNVNGHYTVRHADDIAILINGKFLQTKQLCEQSNNGAKEQICLSTQTRRYLYALQEKEYKGT